MDIALQETAKLSDYGILGIFMIILLAALGFAVRYILSEFKTRTTEFKDREDKCENRITGLSQRLDSYLETDRKETLQVLRETAESNRQLAANITLLLSRSLKE